MRRALAALALAVVLPLPALANVTVKPGETLSEIADRYGVSVNRLMQANGIKDPTLVQVGQRLVIPGQSSRGGGGGGGRPTGGTVVVQPGETLGEIAERSGVSVNRLMQANGIKDPTLVQIGQRLVIPGRSSSGGSAGGGSSRSGSYTVKSGETLGEIAERYNTSAERLMQLNRISDPTQLQAGSRIVVPGGASRTASRTSAQPVRNAKAREHVVQPGESLSEIADSYNLPVQKLVSLNNISDPNLLMSGTRLRLTAPPPVPASRPAPTPPKAASRPAPKPAARPAPAMTAKPKPASTTAAPAAPVTATATTPAAAVASRPRVSPTAAATPAAATPRAAAAQAGNQASPQPTTAAATANAPAPQVAVRQTTTPRATAAAATTAAKPVGPDWRTYGPLQVDWANWQPMGGSFVAPSLNAEGQPLYTAINCGARKLNGTTQTGQWRTWEAPRSDSEQQLVTDLCKAKGS